MGDGIVLFEDQYVDDMRPVTLTRPAFGVTCAIYSLYDVASAACDSVRYVVREHIARLAAKSYPASPGGDGPTLFLNASAVPDVRLIDVFRRLLDEGRPFVAACGQRVAAALVPPGERVPRNLTPETVSGYLLSLNLPLREEPQIATLDFPFHLVKALPGLFQASIERKIKDGEYREVSAGVFAAEGVSLPPTAVFHTEDGPVVLDEGVKVLDFTYFQGPVYVGPRSRVIERSSVKEHVSIGHTCKIGGEVEASIIEPYTNKQHHGFLGHSYLGSWINLGAGTSNSDLKNTYGEIRVDVGGRTVETGMQFFGCAAGDYAKSAINTSIFTGKLIGVASMLYGYVGRNVPSFCNYAKSFGQVTECTLEQTVVTQKRMFARRGVEQTEDDVALLAAVFDLTRDERLMSSDLPVL